MKNDTGTIVMRSMIKNFGATTGLVAALAMQKVNCHAGQFFLGRAEIAAYWGISEASAQRSLNKLRDVGFLASVSENGRKTKWKKGPKYLYHSDTAFQGVYKIDLLWCIKMIQVSSEYLAGELGDWGLDEIQVENLLARYSPAWILGKLNHCEGRKPAAKRARVAYVTKAITEGWNSKAERARVQSDLEKMAKQKRADAKKGVEALAEKRGHAVSAGVKAVLSAQAVAWWQGLGEAEQAELAAGFSGRYGDIFGFDPIGCNMSACWLFGQWSQVQKDPAGDAFVGVDVQANGDLYWTRLVIGPAGICIDGNGIATRSAEVPKSGTMMIDEGDGNTCEWVRGWVAELRAAGVDARTWKGGNRTEADALEPLADVANAYHGNEKFWAGRALDWLEGGRMLAQASMLDGDNWAYWYGLGSRLDLDTRGEHDHYFDTLKLALACAGRLAI